MDITNFDRFLSTLDKKDQGLLLSVAYDPQATQKDLQHVIYSIADKLQTSHPDLRIKVEDIVDTAPKSEAYEIDHQAFDEEESKRHSDYSHSGPAGELINHEKYQSDILDSLAKEHQERAIEELDGIRKGETLSEDQKKILQTIQADKGLSAEEKTTLIQGVKQQALEAKFRDILTRNATAEDTLREQQELLAQQLEEAKIGKQIDRTDENGNVMLDNNGTPVKTTDAAQAIRKRAGELARVRTQERKELGEFQNLDIVKKQLELEEMQNELGLLHQQKKTMLSLPEQERLKFLETEVKKLQRTIGGREFSNLDKDKLGRFLQLRAKHGHLDQTALRNIDGLVKRFSRLTIPEQDALLRRILARQQRRTRGELWKIFDQKDRGRLTGLYKKTLTRRQRRQVLNFQKLGLQKRVLSMQQRPSFNPHLFRRFYNMLAYTQVDSSWTTNPDNTQQSAGDFNPIDSINNARDNINSARRLIDAFKGLGGGGGAGGAGGAAAGAGGGAGGVILIVVIVIIVLILLIVVFIILSGHKDHNSYTVIPLNCNTPQEIPTDADVQKAETRIQHDFFIDVTGDIDKQQPVLHVQKVFYDTTCLLFGNVPNANYTAQVFNSFGQFVVGTLDQRTKETNQLLQFQYTIVLTPPPDPTLKACSIQKFSDSGKYYSWTIYYDPNACDDDYLAFIIARSLAQDLLLQQQHLNPGRKDIFALYKDLSEGKIPTSFCQATQKDEDCFEDTVASYLTWGRLFELQSLTPTPTPTPPSSTTTSTNTTTSSGPSLTLPLVLNALGKFPETYPDTYTYAYTNLFDKVAFFADNNFASGRIDEFVAEVKQCQGPNGNDHTPDLACATLLRDNSPDRQWWLALDRVKPNYQCGAFVWSYEDLYGWPDMQGNGSGGASGWYWRAHGQQDGYEWIPNPYITGAQPGSINTSPNGGPLIQPGDIIAYAPDEVDNGDFGHVAVVKSVGSDQFHVVVQEANARFANGKSLVSDDRSVPLDQEFDRKRSDGSIWSRAKLQGWWRSNTLKSPQPTDTPTP